MCFIGEILLDFDPWQDTLRMFQSQVTIDLPHLSMLLFPTVEIIVNNDNDGNSNKTNNYSNGFFS